MRAEIRIEGDGTTTDETFDDGASEDGDDPAAHPYRPAAVREQQRDEAARDKDHQVSARERAILCARAAADNRSSDVLVLNVSKLIDWSEYFVIATGTSGRQMKAVADAVEAKMAECDDRKISSEGYEDGQWIVIDFVDVVVHLFNPEKRGYYELEHLWGDAERVEWRRPEDVPGDDESSAQSDD